MTTNRDERLAVIERELERQDEAWARARDALARLGDVTLAIPAETLEAITSAQAPAPTCAPPLGVRA
jgi:hypothetical protein